MVNVLETAGFEQYSVLAESCAPVVVSPDAERAQIEAQLAQLLEAEQSITHREAVVESLMSRLDELPGELSSVGQGGREHQSDDRDQRDIEYVMPEDQIGNLLVQAVLDAVVSWTGFEQRANSGSDAGDTVCETDQVHEPVAPVPAPEQQLLQALAESELGEGHPFICPISLRLMSDPVSHIDLCIRCVC